MDVETTEGGHDSVQSDHERAEQDGVVARGDARAELVVADRPVEE
jgi:hypothetical protein